MQRAQAKLTHSAYRSQYRDRDPIPDLPVLPRERRSGRAVSTPSEGGRGHRGGDVEGDVWFILFYCIVRRNGFCAD